MKAPALRMFLVLMSAKSPGPMSVEVEAARASVNHRGDLVFSEKSKTYGEDQSVAAFRAGSWERFTEIKGARSC